MASETKTGVKKSGKNRFLLRTKENCGFNQYWYSKRTIETMVNEVLAMGDHCAFLSTPSVYFSLPKDSKQRKNSKIFDVDTRFKKDPGFVHFDFRAPEKIPEELCHKFDYIVIDPPFITTDVMELYSKAAHLLMSKDAKILMSTVPENAKTLRRLMNLIPQAFRPLCPTLIYQYDFYTNYSTFKESQLNLKNPEVDGE
ncbi:hypothetical protein AAMO2058_000858500 [Amorphochlora amoebiformis]